MKDITNWTTEELERVDYMCRACTQCKPIWSTDHTISPVCISAAQVEIARRTENEDKTLQRSTKR